mmetsp:Transcript_25579/g.65006  ORF Transcript_25579/g.65006 Transcript_25579/m.65006 type:complete len:220 (+) Transcript_25579:268-927(+)|eukprot:CAMPEP_0115851356 /NCGR_PEP_ID=MMETSP0287-20121206/12440_1 /TAXON_ID=412157 /ORGANISM="Chrysochromulina rotalis, Strain UIO044" /LENGTH=219 /DNA_ID=CAMNT_0003305387 /DNA_START=1427 /DNA_END=2086 /DNA_ORIENTATION=+
MIQHAAASLRKRLSEVPTDSTHAADVVSHPDADGVKTSLPPSESETGERPRRIALCRPGVMAAEGDAAIVMNRLGENRLVADASETGGALIDERASAASSSGASWSSGVTRDGGRCGWLNSSSSAKRTASSLPTAWASKTGSSSVSAPSSCTSSLDATFFGRLALSPSGVWSLGGRFFGSLGLVAVVGAIGLAGASPSTALPFAVHLWPFFGSPQCLQA